MTAASTLSCEQISSLGDRARELGTISGRSGPQGNAKKGIVNALNSVRVWYMSLCVYSQLVPSQVNGAKTLVLVPTLALGPLGQVVTEVTPGGTRPSKT